jgi:Holliday junction DNA helicase RuvA
MISSLHGTLAAKSPTEVVVDVQGVGYGVSIPLSTYEVLGNLSSAVTLLTYLHVREDALQLYGFATEEERSLFKLLISVNGIGPKMAQGILSGIAVPDLKSCIASGNMGALTGIPGVGKKLAERMVVELRDKITKLDSVGPVFPGTTDSQSRIRSEALLALTSLGYNRVVAEKALRSALQETSGSEVSLEGLIKIALRHATK